MIRNREAAQVQVTAEQLIHDARSQFGETVAPKVTQDGFRITDKEELAEFLQRKRKDYEDRIRRNRRMLRAYLDYARFEANQEDYRRARSVLERGLTVLSSEPSLWIAYSEIEAKGGFHKHALNVLDRACSLLPRIDSLWFKYVLYEETVGTEEETRKIFERWMSWEPKSEEPWFAYASFEERHGQVERARDVYERYCGIHATTRAYIKYSKWEDSHNRPSNARWIFERSIGAINDKAELSNEELSKPDIWLAFANFEGKRNEPERARAVYEYALQKVSDEYRGRIYASFAAFEKRLAGTSATSNADVIVSLRRRNDYEDILRKDPYDYDAWLDLCRMEESLGDFSKIRDTYSKAPSHKPMEEEKRFWRRYIYFFIYESVFEELIAKDIEKARNALKRGLDTVPHKKFTFAKLWILSAQLEIRQKNINQARKILGTAIGMCPKELQLSQVDRCRVLYQKYLTWGPTNSQAWTKYAEMEKAVGEIKRARQIFELGISQPILDEPEKLWLRYIDFEITLEEDEDDEETKNGLERARALYERLLERTEERQPKVWIAYAKFLGFSQNSIVQARELLQRAEKTFKKFNLPEFRAQILQARVDLEKKYLDEAEEEDVSEEYLKASLKKVAKKVEKNAGEDGLPAIEWLFPEDVEEEAKKAAENEALAKKAASLKMLEMAEQWKRMKESSANNS